MKGFLFAIEGSTQRWMIIADSVQEASNQVKKAINNPSVWYFIGTVERGQGIIYETKMEYHFVTTPGILITEIK